MATDVRHHPVSPCRPAHQPMWQQETANHETAPDIHGMTNLASDKWVTCGSSRLHHEWYLVSRSRWRKHSGRDGYRRSVWVLVTSYHICGSHQWKDAGLPHAQTRRPHLWANGKRSKHYQPRHRTSSSGRGADVYIVKTMSFSRHRVDQPNQTSAAPS